MLISDILFNTHPEILFALCAEHSLSVRDYDLVVPQAVSAQVVYGGANWAQEMVTDAEGQYLDYTRGRR